jgi:hypothetical protein
MWIYVRIYILAQSYLVPRSVLSGTSLIVWGRSILWRNWEIQGLNIDIYVCVASSLSEFSGQRFSFLQLHILSPSKVFGHCSYSTNIMRSLLRFRCRIGMKAWHLDLSGATPKRHRLQKMRFDVSAPSLLILKHDELTNISSDTGDSPRSKATYWQVSRV